MAKYIIEKRNEHINTLKHIAEPGIEPWTPTTLFRSSPIELPRPTLTVYTVPTTIYHILNSKSI